MSIRAVVVCAVVCVSAAAFAADSTRLQAMLDDAQRTRATDRQRARQLLDDVERDPAAKTDPVLIARTQWLECKWTDSAAAAYRAAEIGLAAADRAKSASLRARLTICHARALSLDGKYGAAEQEYGAVVKVAKSLHEISAEADASNEIGVLQYERGAMADALVNLQNAYRLQGQLGNETGRLDALGNIANVYADAHVAQYDRAIEYYRELLVEYEKRGQQSDVADTLFNIGSTLEVQGALAGSELNYRRALKSFQQQGKASDVAFTKRALGSALMKLGRMTEALKLLDEAVGYFERVHDEGNSATGRQIRGIAYRRLGRPNEALRDLDLARRFFERDGNTRFLEKNAEETALAYAQLGDWRNAYDAAVRRAALSQALADTRRDELSSRLRVTFDTEKKDQENRALARESALRATALHEAQRSRKLQLVVSALIALLAFAMAALFWRQVVNTRRMRSMAMTDELTRLPNRRHILAAAEIAFDAAKREHRTAAVIVFDIDRFKRINDTWGHAAGDTVLQSVARSCRLELRGGDQIGRIGGEEFLVVLSSATPQQAREIAERLRVAVEHLEFSSIDPDLRVTISLGVHIATGYDAGVAIAAADSMLFRAKERGRNCVEMESTAS